MSLYYITIVLPENLDEAKRKEIELSFSDKVAAEDEVELADIFRIMDYKCVKNKIKFSIPSRKHLELSHFIEDNYSSIPGIKLFMDDGSTGPGDIVHHLETNGKELVYIKEFCGWADDVEGFDKMKIMEYDGKTGTFTERKIV